MRRYACVALESMSSRGDAQLAIYSNSKRSAQPATCLTVDTTDNVPHTPFFFALTNPALHRHTSDLSYQSQFPVA